MRSTFDDPPVFDDEDVIRAADCREAVGDCLRLDCGLILRHDKGDDVYDYEPGTWRPAEVDQRIITADGWNNPVIGAPMMKAPAPKAPQQVGAEVPVA